MHLIRFGSLSLILVLIVTLLAGCGQERATPLPPATGKTLRIVSSFPYKGRSAQQSDLIRNATDLAIEENRQALQGWTVEHVALDGGDPETGEWSAQREEANARAAARDPNVIAYIGPYASGAAMVSLPILNQAGILQLLPVATWPGLTESGWGAGEPEKYYPGGTQTMARAMAPDSYQARLAAREAEGLGAITVLVGYDASDYSKGMAAVFRDEAGKLGLAVTGLIDSAAGAAEWSRSLAKADLLFVAPSSLVTAQEMARHVEKQPPKLAVISTDVLLSEQLSHGERRRMEGWYVIFNGDSTPGPEAAFRDFSTRFRQRFGQEPTQYAYNAYELAGAALDTAQSETDAGNFVDAFFGRYSGEEGKTGLRFKPNGDPAQASMTLYRLVEGEFQVQKELQIP